MGRIHGIRVRPILFLYKLNLTIPIVWQKVFALELGLARNFLLPLLVIVIYVASLGVILRMLARLLHGLMSESFLGRGLSRVLSLLAHFQYCLVSRFAD